MAFRLGFQIPNFSYGTGVEQLFPTVVAQAREAESAGFDSVFVMDHFYQLPMLGSPDQPMLEAYTALGALATATERVQLGTLVTGNTYRIRRCWPRPSPPSTWSVRAGRFQGIGAGWFELEHGELGYEFGTFTDRFNRLEEALQILYPMLKGERPTFSGEWDTRRIALPNPRYRDRIPMMIGGSGEKKTFPLAVRYADHLNVIAGFDELPGKLDARAKRCDEIGRDPTTLETSILLTVLVDDNVKTDQIPRDEWRMLARQRRLHRRAGSNEGARRGIDGVIINMPLLHAWRRHRRRRCATPAPRSLTCSETRHLRHCGCG